MNFLTWIIADDKLSFMTSIKRLHITHPISFIFLFILLFACSENQSVNPTTPKYGNPDYTRFAQMLEDAYNANSQTLLDSFFITWKEAIPGFTDAEISSFSDTVIQAYKVFKEFYSPTDLSRLTGGQHENFETAFRYIVSQNELLITVVDTTPRYYYYLGVEMKEKWVSDFRPEIKEQRFPHTYLSAGMDSLIFYFFFEPDSSIKKDFQDRYRFLNQAMQLTPHHWVPDFHKMTMPVAGNIIFNNEFTEAMVQFRVFYQFGEAYFVKIMNHWVLTESVLTGIE